MAAMPEDAVVRRFVALSRSVPAKLSHLAVGIGDDAALLTPTRGQQVLTCDWFLEGTHFLRNVHPPDSVGWKCLARALSDIAAMGGTPRVFLLSLALPESLTGGWLDEFVVGLSRASSTYGCALAGGDTTRSETVLISVSVIGDVQRRKGLLRSGARPGDLIYVSGTLGEAEAGLRKLRLHRKGEDESVTAQLSGTCRNVRSQSSSLRKHLYPEPRLKIGQWLTDTHVGSSAMDLSDGLSTDLARLCAASGVGAVIDAARLPISGGTIAGLNQGERAERLGLALNGGDDYELLFTVSRSQSHLVPEQIAGVTLSAVGQITARRTILLRDGSKTTALGPRGWDPFARAT